MAIQPLDLQILFTQIDSVGKSQAVQKEGLVIQQSLQNLKKQEKTEEHIQAVNESQYVSEGAGAIDDRGSRKFSGRDGERRRDEEREEGGATPKLWDPQLGKNVDISG
ncbi:MAG: hypothetical protein LBH85_10020 [Treponema sp.]|jgi:hypothetical protein|nr:hypothetical protein [Treponema sp.]